MRETKLSGTYKPEQLNDGRMKLSGTYGTKLARLDEGPVRSKSDQLQQAMNVDLT